MEGLSPRKPDNQVKLRTKRAGALLSDPFQKEPLSGQLEQLDISAALNFKLKRSDQWHFV
jgi:hypothetical protein